MTRTETRGTVSSRPLSTGGSGTDRSLLPPFLCGGDSRKGSSRQVGISGPTLGGTFSSKPRLPGPGNSTDCHGIPVHEVFVCPIFQ